MNITSDHRQLRKKTSLRKARNMRGIQLIAVLLRFLGLSIRTSTAPQATETGSTDSGYWIQESPVLLHAIETGSTDSSSDVGGNVALVLLIESMSLAIFSLSFVAGKTPPSRRYRNLTSEFGRGLLGASCRACPTIFTTS